MTHRRGEPHAALEHVEGQLALHLGGGRHRGACGRRRSCPRPIGGLARAARAPGGSSWRRSALYCFHDDVADREEEEDEEEQRAWCRASGRSASRSGPGWPGSRPAPRPRFKRVAEAVVELTLGGEIEPHRPGPQDLEPVVATSACEYIRNLELDARVRQIQLPPGPAGHLSGLATKSSKPREPRPQA